jgi:hypothetical protein
VQSLDGRLAGIGLGHVVDVEHHRPGAARDDAVVGRDRGVVGCA